MQNGAVCALGDPRHDGEAVQDQGFRKFRRLRLGGREALSAADHRKTAGRQQGQIAPRIEDERRRARLLQKRGIGGRNACDGNDSPPVQAFRDFIRIPAARGGQQGTRLPFPRAGAEFGAHSRQAVKGICFPFEQSEDCALSPVIERGKAVQKEREPLGSRHRSSSALR